MPSKTRWAENRWRSLVSVHTCKSCTPNTCGTARISSASAAWSICWGAPCIKICRVFFSTPSPLCAISSDTSRLTIGSASFQPNAISSNAATIAPSEPSKSPRTCKYALFMLRLPSVSLWRSIYHATTMFTSSPSTLTASIPAPAISGGCLKRSTASIIMNTAMAISVNPLNSANKISARL